MKNRRLEQAINCAKRSHSGEFSHGQYSIRVETFSLVEAHYRICRDMAFRRVFIRHRIHLLPLLGEREGYYVDPNFLTPAVLTELASERDRIINSGRIRVSASVTVKYGTDCKIVEVPVIGVVDPIEIAKKVLDSKETITISYNGK